MYCPVLLLLYYIVTIKGIRITIHHSSYNHLSSSSLRAVTEPTKKTDYKYNQISSSTLPSSTIITTSTPSGSTRTRKYNPTKRLMRTGGVSSYNDIKKLDNNSKGNVIDILELAKRRSTNPDDIIAACRKCHEDNGNGGRRMSVKEYNIVIKALGDRGYLNSCDDILTIMLESNIKPSVVTYSTLISRAASWQKIQKAETYFKKMESDGIIADVQAYNSLLNAYAKSGDTNRALDVVKCMDKSNVAPNVVTFNTLIDSCARSRNIAKAQEVFLMMKTRGIEPNERSYISLVHALCEAGSVDAAIKLVEKMDRESKLYSGVIYSILLHFLGKEGDIQRAFEIMANMKSKGVVPNVVTFTSLVHACGRHGKLDLAFEIYKEMTKSPKAEDRPNSITCSSLVDACLKAGKVDEAFEIVHDMRNLGIKLTEVTYTSLISELTRLKQLDRILEVFLNEQDNVAPIPIKRKGKPVFPTSAQTLTLGIDMSNDDINRDLPNLSNSTMGQLTSILESLPNLNSGAASAILTMLRLTELLDAALTVSVSMTEISEADTYLIMKSIENSKDINSFSQWIKDNLPIYEDKSTYIPVYQLLEDVSNKRNNILTFYQSIISSSSSSSNGTTSVDKRGDKNVDLDYSSIISEYEAIRQKGEMPGEGIYKSLLKSIAQKSKIESSSSTKNGLESRQLRHNELFRLYLVFQEMRMAGIQPDAAIYNTLINACAGAGDLEKAFEAIEEMQADGLAPDVITYTSLIKACGSILGHKAVSAAEEIFETMQQRTNHFATYTEPNELTFKNLIQVYIEAAKVNQILNTERIWTLLDDILNRGLKPSVSTLKFCMQAAIYDNDADKALKIITITKAKKKYDYYLWSSAANLLSKHNSMKYEEEKLRIEIAERKDRT